MRKATQKIILLFSIFFSINAFAEDHLENIQIEFGDYSLSLPYLFEGSKSPFEGYLLTTADIAVLKLDIDSSKEDCIKIVEQTVQECTEDLTACQLHSDERVKHLIEQNESLLQVKLTLTKELKDAEFNTVLYVAIATTAASAITFLVTR